MTRSQSTAIPTPPPLPVPGTGGAEEIPARAVPWTHPQEPPGRTRRAGHRRPHLLGDRRCGGVHPLLFVALLAVAFWVLSGGGVLWPVWAIIAWSAMIGTKGSHPAARRSRQAGDR